MDLTSLRNEINNIDDKILNLFVQRMEVCKNVAEYKKVNNIPVLQNNREIELINRIKSIAPDELENGAAVLFENIMDISKSLQQKQIHSDFYISPIKNTNNKNIKIGCQGASGSYQEIACKNIFLDKPITYYSSFSDVFDAVQSGEIDFGVLPIINSTAGSVSETYDLMRKYDFYIYARTSVKINHCLAVNKNTKYDEIKTVYSHPQALAQCSEFLRHSGLKKETYANTALAAKLCSESNDKIAAICSVDCAKQYSLNILKQDIADVSPNYTKFICITKDFNIAKNPKTISVALSIPNKKSSLGRLLTKFSVNDLDLEHIESKPLADGSFDVIFYIDFKANIYDENVSSLLNELKDELTYFKFLGNYEDF